MKTNAHNKDQTGGHASDYVVLSAMQSIFSSPAWLDYVSSLLTPTVATPPS
jgi:hypothetical protein